MANTLPPWFWIAYYLFLSVTIGVAIYNVFNRKYKRFSLLVICGHHRSHRFSLE